MSAIISGGYEHELFKNDYSKNEATHYLYSIIKTGSQKTILFTGQAALSSTGIESKNSGNIAIFNQKMIHKVLKTLPDTLSLNAVFKNQTQKGHYLVYLSENGSYSDIKTTRELISNEQSINIIRKIITHLTNFLK